MGELLYAYVICRLDIGYAITLLAKFSKAPHDRHYSALKGIAKYLRKTKNWGLIYWQNGTQATLPTIEFACIIPESGLPQVPTARDWFQFIMIVDAAFANEYFEMRSTSGYAGTLAGAAIVYRCKTQPLTAQNSTDSEVVAAAAASKVAKYCRSILKELGYPQDLPTPVYKDNESAIKIVKHDRPTPRSRHIDIRYFGLQQWQRLGEIAIQYVPGKVNAADCLTKALGWVLHHRHAPRLMGHYGFKPTAPQSC